MSLASQLEAMLIGLFEADLAVKMNRAEPEAAVTAWLGEYVLGAARKAGWAPAGGSGSAGPQDAV
jgi:hypothetical protein